MASRGWKGLKDAVPAAGRKYYFSIIKTGRLMLLRKVILLFSKNYTVAKGQVFNIKTNDTQSYQSVEMRNLSIS